MTELEALLDEAREASPGERINLRDPIAAHGEAAIDAMTDWLGDRRLAAFAMRVLERIGLEAEERSAVIEVLAGVDRTELPPHLVVDLDRSLAALGFTSTHATRPRTRTTATAGRSPGRPGLSGRGYWVMRTSPWERPYLWAEAQGGRLRQGWGYADEQNLEVIAATIRRGGGLTDSQQDARRALRMLASWDGGMRLGDMVVTPNLPEYGRLPIFRVIGSYHWSPEFARHFGH
ncbi:MAG: hypothetical protein M3O94_06400, partial [Actinomycetota bacterium]|nr:hypothetical protein [Actinomycetota bacterium]